MNIKLLAVLVAVTIYGGVTMDAAYAKKKVYTITDRQVELRNKVEASFKANELTQKEQTKLIGDLDSVDASIVKMKEKNGGKLSYKDEGKLEKSLNRVSLTLSKYGLKKRVTAH